MVAVSPSIVAAAGLAVAAYYRMSSDDQLTSIDQQRRECHLHAERNGWRIVAEYIDSGKSGSKDIQKRVQFQKMVRDASRGEWSAILCYDTSRFGRMDSLAAAGHKETLRNNGVHLETVREGRIDWNTSIGRLQDAILSESNHDYSQKLSGNTLRGRMQTIGAGYWPHGAIPFAYDRQYVEGDTVRMFVKRDEPFRKPRNWKLKLVINQAEADAVVWMFREMAQRDTSLRQIGKQITEKGIATPGGGRAGWTKDTVKDVLSNCAYVGDIAIGHHRRRSQKAFNRATPTIQRDAVPAIIDRKTFDAVQLKLKRRIESGRRPRLNSPSALSGVVVCGHCGYRCDCKSRADAVGNRYAYFTCSSAVKRPEIGCKQWRALESELLPIVCRKLVEAVDFEVLKMSQARPAAVVKADIDQLKKSLADLDKKIARGSQNLLLADASLFAPLQAQLIELKAEADRLRNALKLAGSDAGQDERKAWIEWYRSAVRKPLTRVAEGAWTTDDKPHAPPAMSIAGAADYRAPIDADPSVLRDLLHRLNCSLNLHWLPNGNRFYKLDTGRLTAEINPHLLEAHSSMPTDSVHGIIRISIDIRFGQMGISGTDLGGWKTRNRKAKK